ncbi:MAG: hypothetical protein DME65_13145 [Verrucomicrobia bacterium]|nr:MAG: hypothetical protein DME65_13145 [Verrucomicrobiota bacterium]
MVRGAIDFPPTCPHAIALGDSQRLDFAAQGKNAMTELPTPKIVTREEWERARAELLGREKANTHAADELAAARRRLPMTRMEPVMVVGAGGPVLLHDVFEGKRMLMVYHFMWKKGAPHHQQCEGCTHSQVAMNSAVRRFQ